MSFIPQTRVLVLRPFVRTLTRMGVDTGPLLRRVGLPVDDECEENTLVSSIAVFDFLEDAARRGAVEGFGLVAGNELQPEDLGWYGRLLLHSHTGAEMLVRAQYLIRALHSGQLIWAEPFADQVRICTNFVGDLKRGRREAEYFALLASINTCRVIAGHDWKPTAVHLQAAPDHKLAQYEALSEARVLFRQPCTSFLIPRVLLARPMPCSRRDNPAYQTQLEARFRETAPDLGDLSVVRQTVLNLLSRGTPAIDQAAEALAVSPRTLQRRLAVDALTYSRLLDQVRFERARELLADQHLRTIDVALELGYKDQSNFSRAFRRWVGISPGAYRQALLRDGVSSSSTAQTSPAPKSAGAAPCRVAV